MSLTTDGATLCWTPGLLVASVHVAFLDSSDAELSGNGYARVEVASSGWTLDDEDATNAAAITWPEATAAWDAIHAVSLYDAATGGDELVRIDLATSVSIPSGSRAQIAAGDLDLSISVS